MYLRNLTASWLHEVCHDVAVEPPLQPLTDEAIVPTSANHRDDARADVHARGFLGRRQCAFSTFSGLGRGATIFYSRLANLLAVQHNIQYLLILDCLFSHVIWSDVMV